MKQYRDPKVKLQGQYKNKLKLSGIKKIVAKLHISIYTIKQCLKRRKNRYKQGGKVLHVRIIPEKKLRKPFPSSNFVKHKNRRSCWDVIIY